MSPDRLFHQRLPKQGLDVPLTSHLWHSIIQLHILLCDFSAILDRLGPLLDAVALDLV